MPYFDYAANYPVDKCVLEEFAKTEMSCRGNANSTHNEGRKSLEIYAQANKEILSLLGLEENEYEVIYTSSATESNNLAIKGVYHSYLGDGRRLLASEFEHSSVNAALSSLANEEAEIELVRSLPSGTISVDDLITKIDNTTILMCLSYVEDELGAIQPVFEVQKEIRARSKGFLLVDATQAIGKIPCNFRSLDLISFSPHKFGGIVGTGVLIKRKSIVLTPLINGGSSVSVYRSGTPAVGLIASSALALKRALDAQPSNFAVTKKLRDLLLSIVFSDKKIIINSFEANPFIVNLSIIGMNGGDVVKRLDEKGFAISHKSACSVDNTPSKAIMSVYHDKARAKSSFRISLCSLSKQDEVIALGEAIKEVANGK